MRSRRENLTFTSIPGGRVLEQSFCRENGTMGDTDAGKVKEGEQLKKQVESRASDRIGVWQEKIADVEREIRDLEDQLREQGERTCIVKREECEELLNQCVASVTGSSRIRHEAHRLKMEFRNLDTLLELNENLTNFEIRKVTSHLLDQGADMKIRQHMMDGSCGQLDFSLKYTVEESTDLDKTCARVTDLKIDVDIEEIGNLCHVVEKLQQNNDIEGFFIFLQSFSVEVEVRHSMFKQVRTKFKHAVEISTTGGVPHMVISNQNHPGERWEIYWDLAVTSLCRVLPKLHLEVHLSDDSEAREVAETMPGVFQSLMRENSIDSAIQDIIYMVVGS